MRSVTIHYQVSTWYGYHGKSFLEEICNNILSGFDLVRLSGKSFLAEICNYTLSGFDLARLSGKS